jgi:hypothetical protein
MESHGAALKAIQAAYGNQGLFLCGLDRQEHPYDVEDYVRHFRVRFPVYVDLSEDSSSDCTAGLDSVAVLDANHKRVRTWREGIPDLPRAQAVLDKLFIKAAPRPQTNTARNVTSRPVDGLQLSPRMAQLGWSQPVQLGPGSYPRVAAYGTNQVLCVWVAGEVPTQRLLFSLFDGLNWQAPQPVPSGEDAHGPALDVDAKGQPVMAWAQKEARNYRVFFSTLADAEWSTPVAISPAGVDAFRPDVYCPASGDTVIACYGWKIVQLRDYPNSWWRSIFVTTVAGGLPGQICELARLERGSDDCWDPLITGAPGQLLVAWLRDENPPRLFSSIRGTEGWSAPEALLPMQRGGQTFCSVRAASPIKCAGRRDGLVFELNLARGTVPSLSPGVHVYAQQSKSGSWSPPIRLSSGPGRHLAPVAVEDSTGNRLVFWWDLNGEQATIRLCRLSGAEHGASPSELLIEGNCRNLYPAAAADSTGQVWLAWQAEHRGAAASIFAAHRLAQRTSQGSQALSPSWAAPSS